MSRSVRALAVVGASVAAALLIAPAVSAAPTLPSPPRTTTLVSSFATTNYATPAEHPSFSVRPITIDDGDLNDTLTNLTVGLGLTPVAGQRLHVGHYRVDSTGNPAFAQINSDMLTADSEVEILDLAADAYSHVTRLDLLYRLAADQPDSAFGEIRMGEPEAADHALSNHTIYWPRVQVGVPAVLATEFVQNTGSAPLAVGRPSVTSVAAGDYSLNSTNCPAELAVGASCSAVVGYSPRGSGTRTGTLSWPIGDHTDQVALRGQVLPGYTELTSAGANYINGDNTQEFIEGKYLQIVPFYAGEPRPIGFRVLAYPQYLNTVWDRRWDLEVEPPAGERFRVGTFPVPTTDDGKHWFVSLIGERGCGSHLPGTLTIRQAVYDADGYLAQADLIFAGSACTAAEGTAPITVHLAFRSTIGQLQYVNPPPASVGVGSVVPISGVAVPGSTVGVWFKSRTQPAFVQRRMLKADANGRFATSYQAMDDTTFYVTMGNGYLPVQYLTRVKPVIHAPASARRGSVVTLTGTGLAGQQVTLKFTPESGPAVTRFSMADSSGNWHFLYTAGQTLTITAASQPTLIPSDPVTVTVTG